jgi:hypothetical protein
VALLLLSSTWFPLFDIENNRWNWLLAIASYILAVFIAISIAISPIIEKVTATIKNHTKKPQPAVSGV